MTVLAPKPRKGRARKKLRPRTRPIKPRVKISKRGTYRERFAERAALACELGLTDYEIGTIFGVTEKTLHRWKVEHPEFAEAMRTGLSRADERVERSLYSRAVGYNYDSEEIFNYQGDIKRVKVVKHMPPDPTAAKFWLTNRRRDFWRDVQRHEHGKPGAFDHMTADELERSLIEDMKTLDLMPNPPEPVAAGVAPAPAAGVVPRISATPKDRRGVE